MEQLVFVGIIVLFSILEGIARKKKEGRAPPSPPGERGEGRPGPTGTADRLPPAARRSSGVATYDEEPSFDDEVETAQPARMPQGSEGMVPNEVWEEILALARGSGARRPGPSVPEPPPRAPAPTGGRRTGVTAPRRRPVPAPAPARPRPAPAPEPVHPVHLTHPKMGTSMRGRLSDIDARPALPVNRDVRAVRSMMASGRASLRQAVLLSEILAPPAATRGDPYDPD